MVYITEYCASAGDRGRGHGASQAHGEHGESYLGAGSTPWARGTWQGLGEENTIRALRRSPDCSSLPSLAP